MINKQTRLLILTQHFWPEQGATSQLITDLVENYSSSQASVAVLTQSPDASSQFPPFSSDVPISRIACHSEVTSSVVKKLLYGISFFTSSLFWLLRHGHYYDRILIVSNPPFISLLGPFIRLFCRARYILLIQDVFPLSASLAGIIPSRGPLFVFLTALFRLTCYLSEHIIVLNVSMKRTVRNAFSCRRPISVVHNWAVEYGRHIPLQENQLAAQWDIVDKFIVQYSGNLGQLHDIYTIIECARILQSSPNIVFLFIGSGAKLKFLKYFVEKENLSNILIKPYQPRHQLQESLACSSLSIISMNPGVDSIVAPSKLYGILASKKPVLVIASTNSSLSSIVRSSKCGETITNGDPIALSRVIQHLAASPNLCESMAENSLSLYEKNFSKEQAFAKYLDITHSTMP